uniref:Uncharacterized protein n=1 Tax=Rhodnius prolixus TaxID=13249 RepID=A0ABL0E9R0_RHOPR
MLNISIWSRKECAVSDEEQKEKTEERRWRDGSSSPPRLEDGATQTTPTSEAEQDDQPTIPELPEKKERYIVETITMTTVTERRIIRETAAADSLPSEPIRTSTSSSTSRGISDNEMTLTFKLGSNSLKPNSALRQLFPRIASPPPDKSPDSDDDSLQSNLIKRTIERNTLRRSLVRYPDIKKRNQAKKNENSLVERIKKLTCDIDEEERSSPTGEESKEECKVPAYRKITDMFIRGSNKEPHPVVLQTPPSLDHQYPYYQPCNPPDLGNGLHKPRTNEGRKQFLSSLAPLAACVTSNPEPGCRDSVSSAGTNYSLGDIDAGLNETAPNTISQPLVHNQSCPINNVHHQQPPPPQTAQQPPDVVVGTPGTEADELALFVQRDASRIDRLRKRYSPSSDEDQDDYGFNRRPSVRGIKPRFGSTTEILQQMQSQMTPPLPSGSHVSWPYYPEEQRNGYRRYVEEPHYSQNIIHVQQGQSVRLPYQAGPVQVHVMGPSRQVVVRGTQTISTYYQLPRPALRNSPSPGPLLYYPRPPVACGSPTKGQLELRGVPEGASAPPSSHHEVSAPPGSILAQSTELAPHHHHTPSSTPTPPMMYAMNV